MRDWKLPPATLNYIRLRIDPRTGIENLHEISQLDTHPSFRAEISRVLSLKIDRGALSLLCCNPVLLFGPLSLLCLLLSVVFLFITMLTSLIFLLLSLTCIGALLMCRVIRKYMVQRYVKEAVSGVDAASNGTCRADIDFRYFGDRLLWGAKVAPLHGNYVAVTSYPERLENFMELRRKSTRTDSFITLSQHRQMSDASFTRANTARKASNSVPDFQMLFEAQEGE